MARLVHDGAFGFASHGGGPGGPLAAGEVLGLNKIASQRIRESRNGRAQEVYAGRAASSQGELPARASIARAEFGSGRRWRAQSRRQRSRQTGPPRRRNELKLANWWRLTLLTTRALGPSSAFGSMSKTTIQLFGLSAVAGSSGARRVHTPASSALRSGRPRCRCQLSHGNGQGQNASGADLRGSNPELQHHLVERPLEDVGDIRPFDSVPQPLGSARSPQLCLVASVAIGLLLPSFIQIAMAYLNYACPRLLSRIR